MHFPNVYWTPSWCRWDINKPHPLSLSLLLLMAVSSAFTSCNLYYSHPILDVLARDFHTTQAGVSTIPTLAVAGDATGILLILPLADFIPRRRFILTMVICAALFWIGLCITQDLNCFFVLTYLSAMFTSVCQVLVPLVAEMSAPEKRAYNLGIVTAGPTLGILLARIMSGIVANYTSWRNIYWLALGLQIAVFIALWLFLPDYPATNQATSSDIVRAYPKTIWSIVTLFPKYPVLVQAGLLSFCTFFTVSSYWTTLTFLLTGSPYQYSTVVVGLFGLVGVATMVLGPFYGKYVIQPLGQPLLSAIIGNLLSLFGILIGTFGGLHSVAAPILEGLFLDAGLIILQISNRMSIHEVEPLGRNRVNTAFIIMLYLGSLTGTKAGNEVYEKYGGWVASGGLNVGIIVLGFVIIFLRGPYETGWVGWTGGWAKTVKEKELCAEDGDQNLTIESKT